MTRFPRPAALAVAALVAVSSGGCAYFSAPLEAVYAPSDGAQETLGEVTVANAMFLAADAESTGTLLTRLVNEGSEPVDVLITSDDVDLQLQATVEPGQMLDVGPDGEVQAQVEPMGHVPGTRVLVSVVVEGVAEPGLIRVPILDGTLEEYEDLVP